MGLMKVTCGLAMCVCACACEREIQRIKRTGSLDREEEGLNTEKPWKEVEGKWARKCQGNGEFKLMIFLNGKASRNTMLVGKMTFD